MYRSGSAPSLKRPAAHPPHCPFSSKTPYAERQSSSHRRDGGFGPSRSQLPAYSSLEDPHLVEYFDRKFGRISATAAGRREFGELGDPDRLGLRPRSKSAGRRRQEVSYKVAITTSDVKGAGTDAPVYFSMRGTLGALSRRRLAKKTSTNRRARFRFSRGATHNFRFKVMELGDLESISIEHTGIEERDSWLPQSIEVTNLSSKKSWLFVNNHWLSLYKEDGQASRELFAIRCTRTSYEVVVVTGDVEEAGTDSRAFVTIFGRTGITRKLELKHPSSSERAAFKRGSTQRFVLKAPCVGPLQKLRLQQDGSGRHPDWFVERVVVTDLKHPKWQYHFACSQWLSRSRGDGKLSLELLGGRDPSGVPKNTTYRISVFTGNKSGAGTDADVFVKLFGESGSSPELLLKEPVSKKVPFQRGSSDEFMQDSKQLGPLTKLRVWHNNKGFAAGWYLDKVIVDDLALSKVYEFPCYQWLADNEGDRKLSRDLAVRSYGGAAGDSGDGLVSYDIKVKTGDVRNAGTSARVFIVMHRELKKGRSLQSDKLWLKDGSFARDAIDQFHIDIAEMLSPVTKIDIGHDNSGPGAGWFLENVTIYCPRSGCEQTFVCKEWLDSKAGCERTLREDKSLRKTRAEQEDWIVNVHTGEKANAGTDAQVFVALYGTKGKSEEIFLNNDSDNFAKGKTDTFKVHTPAIGSPFKLRVGHDNTGVGPGWYLDKIVLERPSTKEAFVFHCNQWLADSEGDRCTVRELPADGDSVEEMLPVQRYHVLVKTGNVMFAGTDANVHCNLFGTKSDTGNRPLKFPVGKKKPFERKREDEFVIDAIGLGEYVQMVRIGHDGKKPGSGWYLEKVTVWLEEKPDDKWDFVCDRWLDTNEDDGCIERDLTGNIGMLDKLTYNVSVKTGDVMGAGTDAHVFISIFGTEGETGERQLRASDAAFNKFERNRIDLFRLESPDIGELQRIRVRHDGELPNAGWFLDWVRVAVPSQGKQYLFAAHRWLDVNEADRKLEVDIDVSEVTDIERTIPYEILVKTGDCSGAGTDASVFVQIYGEDGMKTDQTELRSRSDNFEQNKLDKFKLDLIDVGPIQKIRIGHDGTGFGDGWFLDHVLIRRHALRGSRRLRLRSSLAAASPRRRPSSAAARKESPRRRYADDYDDDDDDDDDDDVDVDVDAESRSSRRGSRRQSAVADRRQSAMSDRRQSAVPDRRQPDRRRASSLRSRTPRGRSLAPVSEESDSQPSDEESLSSARGMELRRSHSMFDRRRSSARPQSGRRPTVQRSVSRESRDSDEQPADASSIVSAEEEVEEYWFYCRRWLAKDEDDKQIVRELLPTTKDGKPLSRLAETEYEIRVKTGDKFGAGTDANVFLTIFGADSDSGERELRRSETHRNKFENDNEDVFRVKAISLGELRKVKIRHDNAGGGADWYLDHVIVVDPKSKREFYFPCQQWLSNSKGDGLISRDLIAVDKSHMSGNVHEKLKLEKKAATETYHVKVITGDVFGAGTDANCHVVLFGDSGDSGVVPLQRSKTHSNKFERGNTDEFDIELVDIGELRKIKIGHDNSNPRPDWYLERVEIDCPKLGTTWYFHCGEWIGTSKGDGQLEKTLYPQQGATKIYANCVPYEITTYTSDCGGATTSANVFIQIYGKGKQTEQKFLCSKNERSGKFKRSGVDKFVLELEDVDDPIEKIRIGHDDEGFRPGWHLEKVEVRKFTDGKASVTYVFPCGRWLARDEEDKEIVRELVPTQMVEEDDRLTGSSKRREKSMKGAAVSKKYRVHVFTGDKSGAGTNADVFLTLFGDKGDSGERELVSSETHMDKFEKGNEDVFQWEAVDLGKLYKMKIRHNDKGLFSDWYLDRVEVEDESTKEKTVFYAERWLSKKKEDKKLQVTVYAHGYDGDMASSASSMRSLGSSLSGVDRSPRGSIRRASSLLEGIAEGPTGDYNITFTTGRENNMGTKGPVWVRLFGFPPQKQEAARSRSRRGRDQGRKEEKNTGKVYLELEDHDRVLAPGSAVPFSFEALLLAEVTKVEIGNEGVVPGKGWYLQEFRLDVPTQGKTYRQKCKCWFAKDKDDSKTVRMFEFGPEDDSVVSYKPRLPYEVLVETANESEAGTDCRVTLTVYGQMGQSEPVYLDKEEVRFERGRRDLIKIHLEDVGKIHKIRLGHDGQGQRKKWRVDRVTLTNTETSEALVFPCGQIIGKDGKNFVDLEARINNKSTLSKVKYRVDVKTAEDTGAGTGANVFVKLFGELGDSGDLQLKKSTANKKPFRSGQLDNFDFELLDLGSLYRCTVWHDDSGFGSAWKLDSISVEDVRKKRVYEFPCGKWLSLSDGDGQIRRDLTCQTPEAEAREDTSRKVTYEIAITTSDKTNAAMSHNAWLMLDGDNDVMNREFLIENSTERKLFQRGETDVVKLKTKNLGRLQTLHLGAVEQEGRPLKEDVGNKNKWHVFEVVVTDTAKGSKYTFPVNKWVPIKHKVRKNEGLEVEVDEVEETETKGRLSKQRERQLIQYELEVHTGEDFGSGTNANVTINIFGEFGELGKTALKQKGRDLFERKQVDKFKLECMDLGELKKLCIEHDNSGFRPDWLLAKVTVKNPVTGQLWTFDCNQWLSTKKGDQKTFKELHPS